MNASNQRLQWFISASRVRGPLWVWVLAHCPDEEQCTVRETNVWIEEKPGQRKFQAPLRYVRDATTELVIDSVRDAHDRELPW